MVIAASFLFFCSTGLFFGAASWRRRQVATLAGLISIAVALAVYVQSRGTEGSTYRTLADFALPYLFFVSTAVFFGEQGRSRPIAAAIAGFSAIAFAALIYPEMYRSIDWLYQRPASDLSGLVRPAFNAARSTLGWILSAPVSVLSHQAVLNLMAITILTLLFLTAGVASRLFVLITGRGAIS
jgi:hypothetical protein